MARPIALVVLAAALAAASPVAAQRELSWRALEVDARLQGDGTLAVSETQRMLFTGDWNGGERIFRLGFGQRVELDGVFRLDPATGLWRQLARGSLDRVDGWKMTDARTLRWRSRLPSDPPFAATEIDYRIDYRLTGILKREGAGWRLDHDFAFPDRVGPIARFALDLALAPEWSAAAELPRHAEAGPLAPGESYVVNARLDYRGAGAPAHAGPRRLPLALRAGVAGGAALVALCLIGLALRGERQLGRLLPLPGIEGIDSDWLAKNVFALAPEELGAAWDDKVGAAEVAAMLARLQLEGKLASRVETAGVLIFKRQVLHLTLKTDRARLAPAEKKLVDGFFFAGNETDTDAVRAHYRTSGFDPAAKIRDAVLGQLRRRSEYATARPRPPRTPTTLLVLAGLLGLVLSIVLAPADAVAPISLAFALLVTWLPAFIGAFVLRDRVADFGGPAVAIGAGFVDGVAVLALVPLLPMMSATALVAGALFWLGLMRAASTALQSREGKPTIAHRRELARARRWFAAELAKEKPALDDAWLPYLIAFDLAPQMDRWFRAFGGATAALATTGRGGGSWSGSSSGSGGWTGGGGSFGGAGATASWTAAATAMSAGVAAASSGGSGGGGGGGGSSGGGGGGGW